MLKSLSKLLMWLKNCVSETVAPQSFRRRVPSVGETFSNTAPAMPVTLQIPGVTTSCF